MATAEHLNDWRTPSGTSSTNGEAEVANIITMGGSLAPGAHVDSPSGAFRFTHQGDGNLVLYRQGDGRALWASNTAGQPTTSLLMQVDGNLVLYGPGAHPVWASNTAGHPGNFFKLQD